MTDTEPVTPAQPRPVVVTLPGEIDMANADSAYTQITAEVARGTQIVIADMTTTRFCDTLGTRALMQAHERAAEAGSELRVALPSCDIVRVWQVLGVDAVLPIYPSLEEAITGVR